MKAFSTIGPVTRQRLAEKFAAAALRAQQRAVRARAMGNPQGWTMHMNNASRLALKAELLGG